LRLQVRLLKLESNVPPGVRLCDGEAVLTDRLLQTLRPKIKTQFADWLPVVQFSDLIRVKLQELGAGLWLDGDVILFRHFDVDPDKPFFAWEDRHRIGSPVFYVPQGSPFLTDYVRVFDTPDLMPHWLGFKRRVLRPLLWRLQGKDWAPSDLGITIYGNDAFVHLARKHGLLKYAMGTKPFYSWNGKDTERFYDPDEPTHPEDDPGILGLHVHRKEPAQNRPLPGSLYARMYDRLAHRLPPDMAWPG
jgi:hypothetical protein